MELEYEPGRIERRIVSYYFEGLKRKLYDLVSLRLGRDSNEAAVCKDEIRNIIVEVKRVCYGMITEEVSDGHMLSALEVTSIINYVLPKDGTVAGPFWAKMDNLINYTFKRDAGTVKDYFAQRVSGYVMQRIPQIEDRFEDQRAGAISYLKRTATRS